MNDDSEKQDEERRRARQRRTDAQGAASDLARMGIDPRSLGLDAPRPEAPERRWAGDEPPAGAQPPRAAGPGDHGPAGQGQVFPGQPAFQGDDNVVALRPEWAGKAAPSGPPSSPAPSYDRTTQPYGPGAAPPPSAGGPTVGGSIERSERSPGERMLASTLAPGAANRTLRPTARRAAKGMVTLDAAAVADDERSLVARVRRRQAGRRLIAFVAAQGGVGTTTVATGVATVFGALRDDRSALVDVQAGTPPLSALQGIAVPTSVRQLLADADPEAVSIPSTTAGFTLVDGPSWDRPLARADVGGVVERLSADHTFVLADAGDDASDGAYATVTRCDQVVVVAGAGETGLRSLEVALTRVERVNPAAARRAVVVITSLRDGSQAAALRRARELGHTDNTVVLGPDPVLGQGQPFRPELVSEPTRSAMLQVAARVADPR